MKKPQSDEHRPKSYRNLSLWEHLRGALWKLRLPINRLRLCLVLVAITKVGELEDDIIGEFKKQNKVGVNNRELGFPLIPSDAHYSFANQLVCILTFHWLPSIYSIPYHRSSPLPDDEHLPDTKELPSLREMLQERGQRYSSPLRCRGACQAPRTKMFEGSEEAARAVRRVDGTGQGWRWLCNEAYFKSSSEVLVEVKRDGQPREGEKGCRRKMEWWCKEILSQEDICRIMIFYANQKIVLWQRRRRQSYNAFFFLELLSRPTSHWHSRY